MLRIFQSNNEQQLSDEALLKRYLLQSDTQTLGILYERYMPLLYGICLKYLKDQMAAEDAVIQVYEQVARKIAESDVQNFKAWVCTVARNHCLMQLRKDKNMQVEHFDPTASRNFDSADFMFPAEAQEREMQLLLMEKCLEALIEAQKTKVKMFYFEDRSYSEISALTHTDLGTVRSHIQNGRRNLKNCMESSQTTKPNTV